MLPVDAYVPSNKDELIKRRTQVMGDLVGLRQEWRDAYSKERMSRHMAIQRAVQSGVTAQSRLDSIAQEQAFAEWDTVQQVRANIMILEEERDWLDKLLGLG